MRQRLTVVDLFCGAGGLSMGFQLAGFELLWAADNNEAAVRTYRANLGEHVVCRSIREDTEPPEAVVIAGGPPCQGFSSAGMRRPGDKRNTLVTCFAQIVARERPLAFVFENVEGFLTADDGNHVLDLLTPLVAAGYRIHIRKVNAANYGVPQHRKRVIAIGGLGWDPSFPEPTHSANGAARSLLGRHALATYTYASRSPRGASSPWHQRAGQSSRQLLSAACWDRPGSCSGVETGTNHAGLAKGVVARELPPPRLSASNGRHTLGKARRSARRGSSLAAGRTVQGDHGRRPLRISPSLRRQESDVAGMCQNPDVPR